MRCEMRWGTKIAGIVPPAVLAVVLAALFATPAYAGDTVVYYHTDALHSVTVVTNAQGQVIERTYYAPYGAVLNRGLRDGPGYGGHEEDAATGLVYMQQRYYDPQTGQFLSPDPAQPDTTIGGNFNRYWYAKDNPYRYTDPDGRESGAGYATGEYTTGINQPELHAENSAVAGAVGDALNWVDTNIFMPAGPFGMEEHVAIAPLVGVLREAAAGAKTAEAAKDIGEGTAATERAKNIAKGIPESRLGGSGKPKVHSVQHSTRKGGKEATQHQVPSGGRVRFDAHPQDGQKPHFQAEDAKGNNVHPVVHHCVPSKSC